MKNEHVVVVGGGIVGVCVAYHLLKIGARITIVDRDPDGDKASFGNAGGIAVTEVLPASAPGVSLKVLGWMFDPLGPLAIRPAYAIKLIPWLIRFAKCSKSSVSVGITSALAAINLRAYDDLLPLLQETRTASELRPKGALTVYETEEGYRRDAIEWDRKREFNILVEEISGRDARLMEPALGPLVRRAVWTPQWSHVGDPKRLTQKLSAWLKEHGVLILAGEVTNVSPAEKSTVTLLVDGQRRLQADHVVVAAGAWSAKIARQIGDRVLLESERGYNATLPNPGIGITRELIFAERKFVATPLDCGLRVGGAAEFGGLAAQANFERSRTLLSLAQRYLPQLVTSGATFWAGHRPATPDSLPVIGRSGHVENVYYAFGHGHLGLTQAATTGRIISELVAGATPCIDLLPYGIDRFA